MDKIELTKNARRILLALSKDEEPQITNADEKDLMLLVQEDLIEISGSKDCQWYPEITVKGVAYVRTNPKLKNPSIWDDKKYWITTGISIIALAFSIYASFIKQ